jgi:hypothetical protein
MQQEAKANKGAFKKSHPREEENSEYRAAPHHPLCQ